MLDPILIVIATQIIIESLPISSSGHLMLLEQWFSQRGQGFNIALPEHFDHLLHAPTVVIVALYFKNAWWGLVRKLCVVGRTWRAKKFSYAALPDSHKRLVRMVVTIVAMIEVADCATAICYFAIKKAIKRGVPVQSLPVLVVGFAVTAVMLYATRFAPKKAVKLSWVGRSLILGLAQGLALLPGISRFACTVAVGQWLGMSRRRALQTSFLLFFPLMLAALVGHGIPLLRLPEVRALVLQPSSLGVVVVCALVAYGLFDGVCRMALARTMWWLSAYMLVPLGCAVWMMR